MMGWLDKFRRRKSQRTLEFERLAAARIVLLDSPLDDFWPNVVVEKLLFLQSVDRKKPITLRINSPGGSATEALEIVETMQHLSIQVETYCVGVARGAAALILACGYPGSRRIVSAGCVSLTPIFRGFDEAQKQFTQTERQFTSACQKVEEMLAVATGQSMESIRADMAADRRFDAKEAMEYGFVDAVKDVVR